MHPHTGLELLPQHADGRIPLHRGVEGIDPEPRRGARVRASTVELNLESRARKRGRAADVRVPVVRGRHAALGVGHRARVETVVDPLVQQYDLAPAPFLGRAADDLDCSREVARFQGRLEAHGGGDGRYGDEVVAAGWGQSSEEAEVDGVG